MKLFMEDRCLGFGTSCEVCDEIGRKLFFIESCEEKRRLKICDLTRRRRAAATVRASEEGALVKAGETRALVTKTELRFRKFFSLGIFGWYAEGNFEEGNYRIFDEGRRTVASMGRELLGGVPMRCLELPPAHCALVLGLFAAVEVLSSPRPSP